MSKVKRPLEESTNGSSAARDDEEPIPFDEALRRLVNAPSKSAKLKKVKRKANWEENK